MAQVTMDSKEYLELMYKVRELEQLENKQVENCTVEINLDSTYNKIIIRIKDVYTDRVVNAMVAKITQAVIVEPKVMRELVKENKHFLKPGNWYLTSNWDDKPEEGELDLLTNKEFDLAWQAAKEDLENEEEEEQEDEQ